MIQRNEALAAGMTVAQVNRRVARGQWLRGPVRGWYQLDGADPLARLLIATEALNAVALADSALALWGYGEPPARPVVAVASRRRVAGVTTVETPLLDTVAVRARNGIQTVDLASAAATACMARSLACADELVDELLRQGRTTWPRLRKAFEQHAAQGRKGSALLRAMIADREVDPATPLSAWSRAFVASMTAARLPRPELEWRVSGPDGGLVAQVDLAYPELRYGIELDSVAHHFDRVAFERDRERDANCAVVGWEIRRFTWQQHQSRWSWVANVIRADLRRLSGQRSGEPKIGGRFG